MANQIQVSTGSVDLEALDIIADMQFFEPLTSAALNRKFFGIMPEGIYRGFNAVPSGGLTVTVADDPVNVAVVNVDGMMLNVRTLRPIKLTIPVGREVFAIIEATYAVGRKTTQVDATSSIKAADLRIVNQSELRGNHVIVFTANLPVGTTEIKPEHILTQKRQIASIRDDVIDELKKEIEKITGKLGSKDPLSQYALKDSPRLSGIPTTPNPEEKGHDDQIANAGYVRGVMKAHSTNADPHPQYAKREDVKNSESKITQTFEEHKKEANPHPQYATKESPALCGKPTAPTPPQTAHETEIATAAFVLARIASVIGSAPGVMDTLQEISASLNNNPQFANEIIKMVSGKLSIDANGSDIKDKAAFIKNLGLTTVVANAMGSLLKTGGHLSGSVYFDNDSIFGWARNTDSATMGFKNDGDGDTDSYMWFETGDNGNERFKWFHRLSGAKKNNELMSLDMTGLSVLGHPVFHEGNYPARIISKGKQAPLKGVECSQQTGLFMREAYNNGYPTNYGNVIALKGAGADGEGELLIGWPGINGEHAPVFVRSKRDNREASWSEWAQLFSTAYLPTAQQIGACRAYSASLDFGGTEGDWTTKEFLTFLESKGAFSSPYWVARGSWSYASNKTIIDTECGDIPLAGSVVEVIGSKGCKTIRVTTPSTACKKGFTNAQFTYIDNGPTYHPGWRRDYNTAQPMPAFPRASCGEVNGNEGVAWDAPSGLYLARRTGDSALVAHFNLGVWGSCPSLQILANYKNGGIYYRTSRDKNGFEESWDQIFTHKHPPSAKDIGAPYVYSESAEINIKGRTALTTAQFISWLENVGAFNAQYWICRGSSNRSKVAEIIDCPTGGVPLTGSLIEVIGTKNACTIRITEGLASNAVAPLATQHVYTIDNGKSGWWKGFSDSHLPDRLDTISQNTALSGSQLLNKRGMSLFGALKGQYPCSGTVAHIEDQSNSEVLVGEDGQMYVRGKAASGNWANWGRVFTSSHPQNSNRTILFKGDKPNGNITLTDSPNNYDEIIIVSTDDNSYHVAIDTKPMWLMREIVNSKMSYSISIRSMEGSHWSIRSETFLTKNWIVESESSRIKMVVGIKYS